jgi:hypothetical protein
VCGRPLVPLTLPALAEERVWSGLPSMIRPLLLQKFSSASKYAALSVDGEDEDEGDDCTE